MNEHENCHVKPLGKPLDAVALSTAMVVYLAVRGIGCPRCAMRVRNGLLSLEDVLFVEVLMEPGLAIVAYNPERVTTDDLVRAVATAGSDDRHRYRAREVGQVPATLAL